MPHTIGFVGGGTIAFAMASALISRGIIRAGNMYASGPNPKNMERWRQLNVRVTDKNGIVVAKCDIIFICVKPNLLFKCAQQIEGQIEAPVCDADKLFISVATGITIDTLVLAFSFMKTPKIIRALPNTPVQVSEGILAFATSRYVTPNDVVKVKTLFNAFGMVREVPENLMNALTSLNSCGTAYVFSVIKVMADCMHTQDVAVPVAFKLAAQTAAGAARMVLEFNKHPAILRDEICSPGGSAIYGVHELEKCGIRNGFINAIEITTKLNKDLGCFPGGKTI